MDKPKRNKQLAPQAIFQACGSHDKPETMEQHRVEFLHENPKLIIARFIRDKTHKTNY